MDLFTKQEYQQLQDNGAYDNRDKDHKPVVQLVLSGTQCTWLLSEIDPEEPDIAFGLCDLGMGFPELGYVSLNEITSAKLELTGHTITKNEEFRSNFPMSVYTKAARAYSSIITDEQVLQRYTGKDNTGLIP